MASPTYPDLYEASISELQAGLDKGTFTSVDLVKAYFARIEEVNINGPGLKAVIETNPFALAKAAELDEERRAKGKRSELHGIPVLVKDNIATASSEGMQTTAGSYALEGSIVPNDAGVITKLRSAGALILGKANQSEWSYWRGEEIASGWSGRGGQCTNPYYPGANSSGSSSGSAVAVAVGLAPVALGTETSGSLTSPAACNNITTIKPTVGLTSRAGVIPITPHQDTVGPLARSLTDAAILLSIIAGPDPNDARTLTQPLPVPSYTSSLLKGKDGLKGKRLGVPRKSLISRYFDSDDCHDAIKEAFERALVILKDADAEVVDHVDLPSADELHQALEKRKENRDIIFNTDVKVYIKEYIDILQYVPTGVKTLEDVIKFNNEHPELEKPQGQDQIRLEKSAATTGFDDNYYERVKENVDMATKRGIDAVLQEHNLDALVVPMCESAYGVSGYAGYPIVGVPLGFLPESAPLVKSLGVYQSAPGFPFGIMFLGTAWSEAKLLEIGHAFEQLTKHEGRLGRRAYEEAVPKTQLKDVVVLDN